MKRTFFIGLFCLLMGGAAIAQKSDMNAIKSTITAFAKAGDNQDVAALEPLL